MLRDKKLGAIQLSKAKKQLVGQIAISTESHEDLMLAIGKSYLLFNKVDSLQTINKKLEAITATDLRNTANRVLHPDHLNILVYK